MAEVGEILRKKYGPLPLWGWAVAGGAVILVYRRYKQGQTGVTGNTAMSGPTAGANTYGYSSGQNLAGADNASVDSQLQGFGTSLQNIQTQLAGLPSALAQALPAQTVPSATTGNQPVVTPPAAPAPVQQTNPLAQLSAANFPRIMGVGSPMDLLGTISGPGGQYTGMNVSSGAPVWALVNGQYVQGFNPATLPVGTGLYTETGLRPYESGSQVTEHL